MTTKAEAFRTLLDILKERDLKVTHPLGKGGWKTEELAGERALFDLITHTIAQAHQDAGEEWGISPRKGRFTDYTPEQWRRVLAVFRQRFETANARGHAFHRALHLDNEIVSEWQARLLNSDSQE